MRDQRKQAFSVRLGDGDLRGVKSLARRLGIRESDVIRVAIKSLLRRVSPLCDERVRGRQLIPVFLESGQELISHLELDAHQLESIINDGAAEGERVDHADIALLAMSCPRDQYIWQSLQERRFAVPARRERSLLGYLFDKFVRQNDESEGIAPQPQVNADPTCGRLRPAM